MAAGAAAVLVALVAAAAPEIALAVAREAAVAAVMMQIGLMRNSKTDHFTWIIRHMTGLSSLLH